MYVGVWRGCGFRLQETCTEIEYVESIRGTNSVCKNNRVTPLYTSNYRTTPTLIINPPDLYATINSDSSNDSPLVSTHEWAAE